MRGRPRKVATREAALAPGGPDSDDDAPPEEITTRARRAEPPPPRSAPGDAALARAARERQQAAVRAGLRDAAAPATREALLPTDVLDKVAGADLRAHDPHGGDDEDPREAAAAAARRERAKARRAEAAKLEAKLAAQRASAMREPARVVRTHKNFRLAALGTPAADAAALRGSGTNRAAERFLQSHVYGSRLKRVPSARAQEEALAAKRRRQAADTSVLRRRARKRQRTRKSA